MLTETTFAYYGSKGDSVPKAVVLLENTSVARLHGDLGFSITNDSLYKGTHSGSENSVEFGCASAQNLEEWLFPLGSLAGIKPTEVKNWTSDSNSKVATEVFEDKRGKVVTNEVIYAGYLKKVSCMNHLLLYFVCSNRKLIIVADSVGLEVVGKNAGQF